MNALFEIVADALKKYAAEILAAVLFSVSLWKFPKLRRWLTKYKGEQFPQSRQAEAPKMLRLFLSHRHTMNAPENVNGVLNGGGECQNF